MTRPAAAVSNVSLERRAWNIRHKALRMGEVQGQGYIGQALGVADVLATSYFHAMDWRADDPEWEGRDRFYLSIGHYAIALYAALMEAGILPEEELATYGMDDSRMPMSGMASYTPGMEITGGKIVVDESYQTTAPGVFAGGDCIKSGEDLTVQSVEDGKQAAIAIDAFLKSA